MAREWRPSTTEKRIWTIGVFVVRLILSGIAGFVAWVVATLAFQDYIMNPPLCPIGEGPPGCTYHEPVWSVWGASLSGLLIVGLVLVLTRSWQRFGSN